MCLREVAFEFIRIRIYRIGYQICLSIIQPIQIKSTFVNDPKLILNMEGNKLNNYILLREFKPWPTIL